MCLLDDLLAQKNQEIASLQEAIARLQKTNSELHTLLQQSDSLRDQYKLRWILSMKTPEDRVDPLAALSSK